MSGFVVTYPVYVEDIQYKDESWEAKSNHLCLANWVSDSSTTWWWEQFLGSTFRIKLCHRRCFWGVLWPSSVLGGSTYGCWNEKTESPLARRKTRDSATHDTSACRINLSIYREITAYTLILYTWLIYVYAYIYRYIHTFIHVYILFV